MSTVYILTGTQDRIRFRSSHFSIQLTTPIASNIYNGNIAELIVLGLLNFIQKMEISAETALAKPQKKPGNRK